jgi:hypothetical protein
VAKKRKSKKMQAKAGNFRHDFFKALIPRKILSLRQSNLKAHPCHRGKSH